MIVYLPIWACPWAKMHISETAGRISFVRSCMKLSWRVVVQFRGHLPVWPKWVSQWTRTHISETARWIFSVRILDNVSDMKLCSIMVIWPFHPCGITHGSGRISLDGFSPFIDPWNCLELKLCKVVVFWSFATYRLAHGPNNGPMRNSYSFQPVGPLMCCPFSDLWAKERCRSPHALLCNRWCIMDKIQCKLTDMYYI